MAAKGWLIGCGALTVLGVEGVVLVGGYFAGRASEIAQGFKDAKDRYVENSREFPFTVPDNGELRSDRFESFLKVRKAVDAAMSPLGGSSGFGFLAALTSLPSEVSRAQVDALREQSMSIDEYRWISRQLYTTVVAEEQRSDADPVLLDLKRSIEASFRRDDGIQIQTNGSRNLLGSAGLIDFTWLRVPDSTRSVVRAHAVEIAEMPNAVMADTVLVNVSMSLSVGSRGTNPR